jgi:hypothetical protein
MAEVRDSLSCTGNFNAQTIQPQRTRRTQRKATKTQLRVAAGCRFSSWPSVRKFQLVSKIDHLTNMMLHVRRALQNHGEASRSVGACARVFC